MQKKNPTALVIALSVCAFSFANSGSITRDQIEETYKVAPGGTLTIDSDLADVDITTSETDTLRADFTQDFRVSTREEAEALRRKLTVEMHKPDNGVQAIVRWTGGRDDHDRRNVRLHCRIAMPRKYNLDLRTVGSAKVDNLDGTVKAVLVAGSLKLKNVSGRVTARTQGGTVSVEDIGGDFDAKAEGGSIRASRINGRVSVLAEGGSVSIKEAMDSIEARAEGGSVAAYLSKQPRADSKFIANAGNVDLRLAESIAVNLDASCSAGRLSSDFVLNGRQDENRVKGTINGGGPLVMVRASAGNVLIRK
ncbi:MAG TPA: DUF4097 family beta strand repeat-containing protein [Chthoniobacterales bacterium]|jgi:hypothetical protein|nr:DUF4097 family beta strand repeat-containing protein [Chthoniobacterales bacterium]